MMPLWIFPGREKCQKEGKGGMDKKHCSVYYPDHQYLFLYAECRAGDHPVRPFPLF